MAGKEEDSGEFLLRTHRDGSSLVEIPAGAFLAGGRGKDEGAGPFAVALPAFSLALDPVSNRQDVGAAAAGMRANLPQIEQAAGKSGF